MKSEHFVMIYEHLDSVPHHQVALIAGALGAPAPDGTGGHHHHHHAEHAAAAPAPQASGYSAPQAAAPAYGAPAEPVCTLQRVAQPTGYGCQTDQECSTSYERRW